MTPSAKNAELLRRGGVLTCARTLDEIATGNGARLSKLHASAPTVLVHLATAVHDLQVLLALIGHGNDEALLTSAKALESAIAEMEKA